MRSITNTTNPTLETESYKQKIEDATGGLTARYFNLLHDDVLRCVFLFRPRFVKGTVEDHHTISEGVGRKSSRVSKS
jgi:hypothetical protein